MIMDKQQQKIDVRISDIIVSIAPEAIRTLIGVTSSLGTLQVNDGIFLSIVSRLFLDERLRRKRKGELEIIVRSKTV
jgi:hypothetical protein